MKNKISAGNLIELARNYQTPLWVYDAQCIRDNIQKLKQFDVIRYAQKACSNLNILGIMKECGVYVDAVSLGEIKRAINVGFSSKCDKHGVAAIVFTADVFDRETLSFVVANLIETNVGSIDMLHQLGKLSPGHRVWLRVNPGFGHGHSNKTNTGGINSKHGIWHEQIADALKIACQYNLHVVGIHMHIGSGVDYSHLKRVCDSMTDCVIKHQIKVEAISAGGGLSVPYRPDETEVDVKNYYDLWNAARNKLEDKFSTAIRLEIEPGRFLVANSGLLISEVRATKYMGEKHFTLVDAGFNDLIRPSLYGSYHHISAISAEEGEYSLSKMHKTVVAGPLCESGDVFTQNSEGIVEERELPAVNVGDYLVFHDSGAYGASMSSNYNSRPLSAEYLLDGDKSKLIRKRQTHADLISKEII